MPYKDPVRQKQSQAEWYQKHSARIRTKHAGYRKQHKKTVQNWLAEYKKGLKCIRCPENHPACLHFHHRSPAEKSFGIAQAATTGISIERIQEEIEKCDVLCANCHAKEHFK